ncbi:hypothetical protein SEA_ATUIN_292 [Arthrobacter phage Atuin]|nr:hypothetical protein SEA_ATUIN_91 [Arthrobacter phage Atuin]
MASDFNDYVDEKIKALEARIEAVGPEVAEKLVTLEEYVEYKELYDTADDTEQIKTEFSEFNEVFYNTLKELYGVKTLSATYAVQNELDKIESGE